MTLRLRTRTTATAFSLLALAGCWTNASDERAATASSATTDISPEAMGFGDALGVAGFVWTVAMGMIQAGQPDIQAQILYNTQALAAQLTKLQAAVDDVRTGVKQVDTGIAEQNNLASLDRTNDALVFVTNAHAFLTQLATHPTDPNLLAQADSNSRNGVVHFETYPEIWKRWSSATESRFDPRIAYPGLLVALGTRIEFLKSQYTPAQLSSGAVALELQEYAAFMQHLIDSLDQAVSCTAWPFTSKNPNGVGFTCNVAVQCRDGVALAPSDPSPPGTYQQTTCIQGGTFDPSVWTAAPDAQLRDKYWRSQMVMLRNAFNNFALYGYPTGPYYGPFGAVTAPLVSTMNNKVVDTRGTTSAASRPEMEPWTHAASQVWVFGADGTIRSKVTGFCLEVKPLSNANGFPVDQTYCYGGLNQQWNWGNGDGPIVNAYSGKCLDIAGIDRNDGALLIQWDCWGGPNQSWTTAAPDVPLPR